MTNDGWRLAEMRKIAADASLVSTLRKVAIHAIDQLGGAEDVALLESLPQNDGTLFVAVQPAQEALRRRTPPTRPESRE